MKNKSVSIIGAGIGGLTTAVILKKKNLNVHVYERASKIEAVGAGILIGNNAMQVIKKIGSGLYDKFKSVGHRVKELRVTDEKLNPLSVIDLSFFERLSGVDSFAIHRRDIHRILADEVGDNHISLGKTLQSINQNEKLTLNFEDKTSQSTDLLIGADGIRSLVREKLFPQSSLRDAKQLCWRGVCEIQLSEKHTNIFYDMWGRKRRFGFTRINEKEVYWYAMINTSNESIKIENSELAKEYAHFYPEVVDIINATDVNRIIKGEIKDLNPIDKWYNTNVCLLGDAAHSTTPNFGQGASQAIEDAYILGECLEKYEGEEALRQYQNLRIKKANMVVGSSWKVGKLAMMENSAGVWLRNSILKLSPSSMNQKNMKNIFELDYKI